MKRFRIYYIVRVLVVVIQLLMMMKTTVVEVVVLLFMCVVLTVAESSMQIVSYIPEWRFEGLNWNDVARGSTHVILFSLETSKRGEIIQKDRLPRKEVFEEARRRTREHGTKLMICFGGNGRSRGFGGLVKKSKRRRKFLSDLKKLIEVYDLDGVDYNWEYPGYIMGKGYMPEDGIRREYEGFGKLLKETREVLGKEASITLAYYPDGRQEKLLMDIGAIKYVNSMHSMAYDQNGKHSTMELAKKTVENARTAGDSFLSKMTLGLPFYGRHVRTGEWKSYEDIVSKMNIKSPDQDEVDGYYFNGPSTIRNKVKLAIKNGLAGVMIWETGQDCRVNAVTWGDTTHEVTCPNGSSSSLLIAIHDVVSALEKGDDL